MTTETRTDLYSPDTYAQSMPHDEFTALREREPVAWQKEPHFRRAGCARLAYLCLRRRAR